MYIIIIFSTRRLMEWFRQQSLIFTRKSKIKSIWSRIQYFFVEERDLVMKKKILL